MTVTLRALREQAVRGYKRNYYAEGTTPTLGTTTILADNNRQEPPGEWDRVDTFIHFVGGSLNDEVRLVTGFTAGQSIQFSPAVSAAVPSGQQYALYKQWEPRQQLPQLMNEGLRTVTAERRIYGMATAAEVSDVYTLTVPAAASGEQVTLLRVDRSVGTVASPYDYQELFEGRDYELWRVDGSTTLRMFNHVPATGTLWRFFYERLGTDLVADTDTNDLPLNLQLFAARTNMAINEGDHETAGVWQKKLDNEMNWWLADREDLTTTRPRIRVY